MVVNNGGGGNFCIVLKKKKKTFFFYYKFEKIYIKIMENFAKVLRTTNWQKDLSCK